MRVTIDDIEVEAKDKESILSAARRAGVRIPTICFLEGHRSPETCGVCMVEVEGINGFVPACSFRVSDGIAVRTDTDEVRNIRRAALELLLSDHLGDCEALCERACPAGIDIPRFLRLQAQNNHAAAIAVIKERVAFPGVLGRICAAYCERACRRKGIDEPVSICALKRFASDWDRHSATPYRPEKKPSTGKNVAVVGAGLAGLTAAYHLLQMGHSCALFEADEHPGGALLNAPELPPEVVTFEIERVLELGAETAYGKALGRDIRLESLRNDYDAVILATGTRGKPFPEIGEVDRKTFATKIEGVYAAGNLVRSNCPAVWASAMGQAAAQSVSRRLAGQSIADKRPIHVVMQHLRPEELRQMLEDASPKPRFDLPEGVDPETAAREAKRCLRCACVAKDDCLLRDLATEYDADPRAYPGERKPFERDAGHSDVIYEPAKCICCGRCVIIAGEANESLGLTVLGRGFRVRIGVPFNESIKAGLREVAVQCAEVCPTGALALRRRPE